MSTNEGRLQTAATSVAEAEEELATAARACRALAYREGDRAKKMEMENRARAKRS